MFDDTEDYIKDRTDNKNAVSKIDENNLNSIAKDLNIEYIYMDKQSNINKKLKDIGKKSNEERQDSLSNYENMGNYDYYSGKRW